MKGQNKENQAMQKGKRRQNLKEHQNNRGTKKNPSEYDDYDGRTIE